VIVWLASYPRSGNTLLRLLCWRVFGIDSTAVYYTDKGLSPLKDEGFTWFNGPKELRETWGKDNKLHLLKTHFTRESEATSKVTPNNIKTLFVVRDGRPATVSFYHYYKDYIGWERPLMDIAKSNDWSQMLTSWVQDKPNTLMLKYEDVLAAPDKTIDKIAEFLKIKPIGKWVNDFDKCKAKMPLFFRSGNNDKWKSEWSLQLESAFMQANGEWMRKLGYVK